MNSKFAKRSLGQNFLSDLSVINRIVEEVVPQPGNTIVEIGPGRGALTAPLIDSGARVIAIELDDALSEALVDRFADRENFYLVTADALAVDFGELIAPATTARVVANLPYNISTAIIQRLFEQSAFITDMTLMLQREVVDRISAGPDDPERGFLSVLVEAHAVCEKLFDVPPAAFRPAPKVLSSVARLTIRESVPGDVDEAVLWKLVGAGFQQRRKTILNNLKSSPVLFPNSNPGESAVPLLASADIEPGRRAQSLTLEEWVALTRAYPQMPTL